MKSKYIGKIYEGRWMVIDKINTSPKHAKFTTLSKYISYKIQRQGKSRYLW